VLKKLWKVTCCFKINLLNVQTFKNFHLLNILQC